MKTLETVSLRLRAWSLQDVDDLYEYAKSPHVGPNAGWKPHENKAESLEILTSFINDEQDWAVVYKENGKVIGSIGLHDDPKRLVKNARLMGYVLHEAYWGRGLATQAAKAVLGYAFEQEDASIVSIAHYPFNKRSGRVIEKCGFVYEGTLRRAFTVYDGSVYDLVCYSMLQEDYQKNKECSHAAIDCIQQRP